MVEPTPPQTVGPFFHDRLLHAAMNVVAAEGVPGERIRVEGRVLDGEGGPVDDAMVEVWQADAGGRHATEAGAFVGFGRSGTDDEGRFWFETVKPGRIANGDGAQAPHLDVHVFARGLLDRLATRVYFGDEDNASDPVLSVVPDERRATMIAELEEREGLPVYRLDIVLQGPTETVFFDA